MFLWFLVWLFGFLTGAVLVAYLLKHVFKVKWRMWLLNDTVDGDYGADWWLKREGLKPGVVSAWLWWWRNMAYNYLLLVLPDWNNGEVDDFLQINLIIPKKQMLDEKGRYNAFTKANKEKGIYGINHYCYLLNGKVYCNYSRTIKFLGLVIELQFGAGGNEYRFFVKP